MCRSSSAQRRAVVLIASFHSGSSCTSPFQRYPLRIASICTPPAPPPPPWPPRPPAPAPPPAPRSRPSSAPPRSCQVNPQVTIRNSPPWERRLSAHCVPRHLAVLTHIQAAGHGIAVDLAFEVAGDGVARNGERAGEGELVGVDG